MPALPFLHVPANFIERQPKYSLPISGVAGFFGGEVAIAAMSTVHIYRGRKWLGWYNSPGSHEIAQRYGVVANWRLWDGLYPGVNDDPSKLFGLEGKSGPSYRGVTSGTVLAKTGQFGYLLLEGCRIMDTIRKDYDRPEDLRRASTVTVVTLEHDPPEKKAVHLDHENDRSTYLALITIASTLAASIMCVLVAEDWVSFALYVYGALASGVSCFVIGSGTLEVICPKSTHNSTRGVGVLNIDGDDVVVLAGRNNAITAITEGKFLLTLGGKPQYHQIGGCAILLTIQFLAQLLAIPAGTLFGQLMFLASLFVSWLYSAYLASIDRESLQRQIIDSSDILGAPKKEKHGLRSRTAMTVFLMLTLFHELAAQRKEEETEAKTAATQGQADEEETRRQLDEARGPADEAEAQRQANEARRQANEARSQADEARSQAEKAVLHRIFGQMLPNDTPIWTIWRAEAFSRIIATMELTSPSDKQPETPYESRLTEGEKAVLGRLRLDLEAAIKLYRRKIQATLTTPSTQEELPRPRASSSLRDRLYASKARIIRLYRVTTTGAGNRLPDW
ncbi:hypothetical protein C8Q76DRAFT_209631 [Earliella scabrosa]|nr:hypothetical protein C8Q76DRAFT_209631 [Earliella scabrosa]